MTDLCASHLGLVGRPRKLTVELTDQVCTMLRSGVPMTIACAAVGVAYPTYSGWLRDERPEFQRFKERTEEAQAFGTAKLVAAIAASAPSTWQAAGWMLERTQPETFARITQRELAAKPDTKPSDPFTRFVPDELSARRASTA